MRRDDRDPPDREAGAVTAGTADRAATEAELSRVVREEAGRLTAAMVRLLDDFDVAEDAVQDAP